MNYQENERLVQCASSGDLAGVKEALRAGANVRYSRNSEVLDYLVKEGLHDPADMFYYNVCEIATFSDLPHTDDAFITACEKGHLEVAQYLEDQGAYIRARHDLALRKACTEKRLDIVKYLLTRGANVDYYVLVDAALGQRPGRNTALEVTSYVLDNSTYVPTIEAFYMVLNNANEDTPRIVSKMLERKGDPALSNMTQKSLYEYASMVYRLS